MNMRIKVIYCLAIKNNKKKVRYSTAREIVSQKYFHCLSLAKLSLQFPYKTTI